MRTLAEFLAGNGVNNHHIQVLKENHIDGDIFSILLESDFDKMFTVGIVRKLMSLQKSWIKAKNAGDNSDATMPIDSDESSTSLDDILKLSDAPPLQREDAILINMPHVFRSSANGTPQDSDHVEASNSSSQSSPVTSKDSSIYPLHQSTPVHNSGMSSPDSECTPLYQRGDIQVTDSNHPQCSSTPDDLMVKHGSVNQSPPGLSHQHTVHTASTMSTLSRRSEALPLPVFSSGITHNLVKGNVHFCISKIVEECSYHILQNGDMKEKGSYAEFAKRLCERYPCLRYSGRNPWTHLSTKLSQKLRNIRWYQKKSVKTSNISFCSISGASNTSINEANHLMRMEFAKTNPNWNELVPLFNQVHHDRRQKIKEFSSRSISEMLQTFPTLSNIKLVREEFKMLQKGKLDKMRVSYYDMMNTLGSMFELDHEKEWNEGDEVKILLQLQAKLTDNRIKAKPAVCAINLQQAHSIELKSKKMEPPHLLIAQHDDGHHQGWILADETCIACHDGEGIQGMIVDIMSSYYAWDLSYPKGFLILGFLQETVLGDCLNSFYKSAKFQNFQKQFNSLTTPITNISL